MQSKMVNEIKGFENIVGYEIFEDGTVISYKKKQPIKSQLSIQKVVQTKKNRPLLSIHLQQSL